MNGNGDLTYEEQSAIQRWTIENPKATQAELDQMLQDFRQARVQYTDNAVSWWEDYDARQKKIHAQAAEQMQQAEAEIVERIERMKADRLEAFNATSFVRQKKLIQGTLSRNIQLAVSEAVHSRLPVVLTERAYESLVQSITKSVTSMLLETVEVGMIRPIQTDEPQ